MLPFLQRLIIIQTTHLIIKLVRNLFILLKHKIQSGIQNKLCRNLFMNRQIFLVHHFLINFTLDFMILPVFFLTVS